ncbi:MAG: hypothetical protein QNK37_36980 [Acidobacteriota bacterium]|nr:hypothetical protein [Acidobacteriota bacterium]
MQRFFKLSVICFGCLAFLIMPACNQPGQPEPPEEPSGNGGTTGIQLPEGFPKPVLSGKIPLSVPLPNPPAPTDVGNRPYFDYFSWQSFIALNWPADTSAERGTALNPNDPGTFKNPPAGAPTVWATYREAFELFSQGDKRPVAWNADQGGTSPCGDGSGYAAGHKVFVMAGKGGTLLDEINEAFSFPLIDQQLNYAYSEVRFDKAQYDFVRGDDNDESSWLYLMKNLVRAQPVEMPVSKEPDTLGALMLKATWKILIPGVDDESRYYTVDAQLYDPGTQTCSPAKVGLVGFHIVQKLEDFKEWIWSSFEQVDNLQAGHGAPPGLKPSFNNGTDDPKTVGGFANRPKAKVPPLVPKDQRTAVQVTRLNPIPDTPPGLSTQDLNKVYRELLKGTPFEYYQLIITQWPTNAAQFKTMEDGGLYPADSGQPFPVDGCTNTVMETYFQSKEDASGAGGNSCMSCHYVAGKSDYSWVLQLRAH